MNFQLVLITLFASCNPPGKGLEVEPADKAAGDSIEIAKISDVFLRYTAAIKNRDGKSAIGYLCGKNIDYYDSLIKHALYSDEAQLKRLNILTRIAVLRMRHSRNAEELDTMNGRKILVDGWNKGLMGDFPKEEIGLTDFKISGKEAIAALLVDNQNTGMGVSFIKEGMDWKVDIMSNMQVGIEEMEKMISDLQVSETQYAVLILKELEGVTADSTNLFEPLKP